MCSEGVVVRAEAIENPVGCPFEDEKVDHHAGGL
jgi:hypothetical protein